MGDLSFRDDRIAAVDECYGFPLWQKLGAWRPWKADGRAAYCQVNHRDEWLRIMVVFVGD